MSSVKQCTSTHRGGDRGAMYISGPHRILKVQKQAIKIPEGALKSSLGTLPFSPHPLPLHPPLFLCPLSICSPPLLFLSIVSTKHPIHKPMTSLTAGSGRLNEQWAYRNKRQFIRQESDRKMD